MKPIVLIVEDLASHREVLCELLSPQEYHFIEAEDGDTALLRAKESPPDLVLLDVMMPGIDGYEVCRRLRKDKRLAEVPILFLTALNDHEARLVAMEAGGDGFISKPYNPTELRARVKSITRLNRYRRLMETQDKLHDIEMRFQKLAEHSTDVFWFVNRHPEKVDYIGPAMEALTGLPIASFYADPRLRFKLIHQDDQLRVEKAYEEVLTGRTDRFEEEYRMLQPTGDIRWVLDSATPINDENGHSRVGGVIRDITDRRDSEDRMLRAQRLENIGMLAAGIAHDFNNALAPILMAEQILRQSIHDESSLRLLNMVGHSAERGASLVKQLLSFARGASDTLQLIQARHILNELIDMIEVTFPKFISIRSELPKDLWTIKANPTEIHQVFLNLCVNARDAMSQGGELTLSAKNRSIDSDAAAEIPDARVGDFLVIEVRDTGTGISPEVLKRLWEPFYTTKTEDSGTGLGLSTVRGIVHHHGGFIALNSRVNYGTTFTIYIPAAESPENNKSKARATLPDRGRGELVLVVDDEEPVRLTVSEILHTHGYNTLLARDGAEAIAVFAARANDVKLLLTDIQMPFLNGSVLSTALHRIKPNLPVIAMSGAGSHASAAHKEYAKAFLAKPFLAETLLSLVRRTLDKSSPHMTSHQVEEGKIDSFEI